MPLLNYTTSIEAPKTVSEIKNILASHGARVILSNYDKEGRVESLSFEIETPQGIAQIILPVDPEAVLRVMMRGKVPRRLLTKQQAIRVAWRIVKDWVEAQMAILETEMVKMEQIFLPYVVLKSGETFFEVFEHRRLLNSGENKGGQA